jgi:hypothetical protein
LTWALAPEVSSRGKSLAHPPQAAPILRGFSQGGQHAAESQRSYLVVTPGRTHLV